MVGETLTYLTCSVGFVSLKAMTIKMIIALIVTLAPQYNIDPKVALAVAAVESGYNSKAIGTAGEVGLFQIMPNVFKHKGYTKKQMLNPRINIIVGLEMLRDAKNRCVHKHGIDYLVCYNAGIAGGKRYKHPSKSKYVKQVAKHMKEIKCENTEHVENRSAISAAAWEASISMPKLEIFA